MLCAGQHPDYRSIARFRARHLDALSELSVQAPQLLEGRAGQRAAGMRHRSLSVRRDFYRDGAAIALHPQGDLPELGLSASATRRIPAQPDVSTFPTPRPRRDAHLAARSALEPLLEDDYQHDQGKDSEDGAHDRDLEQKEEDSDQDDQS
jgi:hypothetical protein